MIDYYEKTELERKAENFKKIIPSFELEHDDWYLREDNNKRVLNKIETKICFIKYRSCTQKFKKWKNSFMIDVWICDDMTKVKGYNEKKFIYLWKYHLKELYGSNFFNDNNKISKNKAFIDFYFNGLIEANGLEADSHFRSRIEYDNILKFFKEILDKYHDYYFVNLDQILQNIMNQKYEIILEKIKESI